MNEIAAYMAQLNVSGKPQKPKPQEVARAAIVQHLLLRDFALCGAMRAVPAAEELAVMVEAISNGCKCCTRGLRWLFEEARRWKVGRRDPRPLNASDLLYVDANYTNWGSHLVKPGSVRSMLPAPDDQELLQLPAVRALVLHLNNRARLPGQSGK